MKKSFLLFILTVGVLAILLSSMSSFAEMPDRNKTADMLNELGLFKGTDKGYELDKGLTRAEAVTMVVRFLGDEQAALYGDYSHPFSDVSDWAKPYVAYAYSKGITKGISDTLFDSNNPVTGAQFLTFMLRVLNYDDSKEDFAWDQPEKLAQKVGLLSTDKIENFTRGDMVMICYNALRSQYKNTSVSVSDNLIKKEVFSSETYENVLGSDGKNAPVDKGSGKVTVVAGGGSVSKPSEKIGHAVIETLTEEERNENFFLVEAQTEQNGKIICVSITLTGKVELCGFDMNLVYDSNLCKLIEYNTDCDLQVYAAHDESAGQLSFNYAGVRNLTEEKKILTATFEVIASPGNSGVFSLNANEVIATDSGHDFEVYPTKYDYNDVKYQIK